MQNYREWQMRINFVVCKYVVDEKSLIVFEYMAYEKSLVVCEYMWQT